MPNTSHARAAKPRIARAAGAASQLARDSCSATFSPRIFEQKRDCSQSTLYLNNRYTGLVCYLIRLSSDYRAGPLAAWLHIPSTYQVKIRQGSADPIPCLQVFIGGPNENITVKNIHVPLLMYVKRILSFRSLN